MPTLTGGCLCGAIRYTVDAEIKDLRACHCTNCQKASGAGGSVNAVLPSSAVKFTKGTPKRYAGIADSGRTLYRFFCGDCGSPLYSQRETAPETMVLRIGTLDNPPDNLKITAHIWTRSARSWDTIDPAAKQFPQQPDSPPATK
jgi:hypothetical protein